MQIFKLFLSAVLFITALLFSGCQGNNSEPVETNTTVSSTHLSDYNSTQPAKLSFVNDSEVNVTANGQIIDILILAKNSANSTNTVGRIGVEYLNNTNTGLVTNAPAAIENGVVSFSYKAPDNLQGAVDAGITFTKLRFYSIDDPSVNITLKVDYTPQNSSAGKPVLKTLTLSQSSINITHSAETKSLTLFGYTNQGTTNINANIGIKYSNTDIDVGYFTPISPTITDGRVTFTYNGPSNLLKTESNISKTTFTFYDKNNTNITTLLTVNFSPSALNQQYANYKLTLVDVNRTITAPLQQEVFDLYLKGADGRPAENEPIVIDYFDGSKGTVNTFKQMTDANGHAQFLYTAPADLTNFNNSVITFRVENTTAAATKVSSTFTVSTNTTDLAKLQVATPSITLSRNGETVSIDIFAFNGNNEPFTGGSVMVQYPDSIVNSGVEGGHFLQTSVPITDGKATFNFVGPDPLSSNVGPLNFKFVYSAATNISTTLTINYVPDIPKLVFNDSNITVTKNGEVVNIDVSVYDKYNTPYEGGNIKIKYPNSVLSGKDVGSFNTTSASIINGKAHFIYTAPNPLDGNDTFSFTFYHDAQPLLSEKDLNITITPASGQIILTNYDLNASYDTSMNLNSVKPMTFFVEDENGIKIHDSNITSMKVSVLNTALASLIDSAGHSGTSLTINNKNSVRMNLKSTTISGIVPIKVYTEFKDANNDDKNLTKVFNVIILSGPPTAMSLSYVQTSQNTDIAKFVEDWVLTVTDKYNNLVNTSPAVSLGAIIGYAKASASVNNIANYLYVDATNNDGNLTDTNPDTFISSKNIFNNVDLVNDKLVLFGGTGYKFEAYGKWDIDTIAAPNKLTLLDDYNGAEIDGLGYTVGHNFRNEVCSNSPAVANVYAKDNNNILDSTGSMIVQIEYDYYLVGKDVVLWANLVGDVNGTSEKVGIGRKVTLRGQGLTGASYSYAKGFEGVVRLNVTVSNSVEKYKNANFSYSVEVTGEDTNWTIIGDSMTDGNITDCSLNHGVGYVDVNVTDPAGGAGEINLINVLPSPEF